MALKTNVDEGIFIRIPIQVCLDTTLPVDAKIIFGLLLTRAFSGERPNEVWVGQEKVALITGIGLTKTKALIKLLCSRGFLQIEKKSGFSGRHNSYRIASLREVYGHGLLSLEKWTSVDRVVVKASQWESKIKKMVSNSAARPTDDTQKANGLGDSSI